MLNLEKRNLDIYKSIIEENLSVLLLKTFVKKNYYYWLHDIIYIKGK